ncbi:MAG: MMPL family transporter [Proteobacteria bacterium]|nr:MMPL family transporter [Pseudomonadota bacterium]
MKSERVIDSILKNRIFYLVILFLITTGFFLCLTGISINGKRILPGLRIDNSMEVWVNETDPAYQSYLKFNEQFGDDDFVIIAFKSKDIFTPSILHKISDLTEKLKTLPYILQVISLTNTENVASENDEIVFNELMPEIPETDQEIRAIKEIAINSPLFRDNLISADGTVTAIILKVKKQEKGKNYQRELTDKLFKLLSEESENGKYSFHAAGVSILIGLEDKASTDDAVWEYSLSTFIVVFLLYLIHGRFIYIFISFSVIIMACIWTHGLLPLFGSTFNMVNAILATLILVIGIADTIHFIAEYKAQYEKTGDSPRASKRAWLVVFIPCLFTSLTTAVGFASMTVSNMKVIQEFGIYASIAMFFTFIINMILVPIILSRVKRKAPDGKRRRGNKVLEIFLDWVAKINKKHVKINLVIAGLVFLVSLSGLVKIEVNTHELQYFRKDHPIRVSTEFIENNLTGTTAFEIMLTGEAGIFKEPEQLQKMEALQAYVTSVSQIQKTISMIDFIKEMNKVFQNNDAAYYTIPKEKLMIEDLLFLGEGSEELEFYVDTMDYSAARIHGRLNYVDSNTLKAITQDIEAKIRELYSSGPVKAEVSGIIPIYINMIDYLIDSQVKGFSIALLSILFMLALLVRSVKLALLAMIPNIIPVFLTFGLMGWIGINLDLGTVLIASIAIGLAVDDTIHLLSRFRYLFNKYRNYERAIDETIKTVGAPVTITSVVLFFGFGVAVVSTFKPIAYFGLLSAITMISALLGDLFVLPALIKVFKPFGAEKISPENRGVLAPEYQKATEN